MFQGSQESDNTAVNDPGNHSAPFGAGAGNYTSNIFPGPSRNHEQSPRQDWRRPRLVGESLPVVTACHPRENGVLAWMLYAVIGL